MAAYKSLFPRIADETAVDIQYGAGVPSHTAAKGTIYINTSASSTTTRLYINTNGGTTWTAFTAAA